MEPRIPLILDSATKLGSGHHGCVAYCASHGGLYPGWLAARAGVAGVILCDAGVGIDQAGIGGLDLLQRHGIPAATIGHRTARIGDGADGHERGRITYINAIAAELGVKPGMRCAAALARLAGGGESPRSEPLSLAEARTQIEVDGSTGIRVYVLDSNSLVKASDQGQIVITGSHGGVLAKNRSAPVNAPVYAAVYNDADRGIDDAGVSRLPALDRMGIAGVCVSAWTARIGDGMSTYRDGVLSAINETARRRGASLGSSTEEFVRAMVIAHSKEKS